MIGEIKILKTCEYNFEPKAVLITRKGTIKNNEDGKVDCYYGLVINEGYIEQHFLEKDLVDCTLGSYLQEMLAHDTDAIQAEADRLKDTAEHFKNILIDASRK